MEKPFPDFRVEQHEAQKPYELPSDDALLALALVRDEFGAESEEFKEALDDLQFATITANYPDEVDKLLSKIRNRGNYTKSGSLHLSEKQTQERDDSKDKLQKLHEEAAAKIIAAIEALA